MTTGQTPQAAGSFPRIEPSVSVARIDEPTPEVEWPELRWWFIAPELGQSRRWAIYDSPQRELADTYVLEVAGKTQVHEEECFEIRQRRYDRGGRLAREAFAYGHVKAGIARWLAWWNLSDTRKIHTYRDASFADDWGRGDPIRLVDVGRYRWLDSDRFTDGHPRSTGQPDLVDPTGAGLWQLSVGETRIRCVRVIQVRRHPSGDPCRILDGFVTEDGKGVLRRRYEAADLSHSSWEGRTARDILKGSATLTYNDATFLLWFDSLTEDVLAPR